MKDDNEHAEDFETAEDRHKRDLEAHGFNRSLTGYTKILARTSVGQIVLLILAVVASLGSAYIAKATLDDSRASAAQTQKDINTQLTDMHKEVGEMKSLAESSSTSAKSSVAQTGIQQKNLGAYVTLQGQTIDRLQKQADALRGIAMANKQTAEANVQSLKIAKAALNAYQTLTGKAINITKEGVLTAKDNLAANILESRPYLTITSSQFNNINIGQKPTFVFNFANVGRTRAAPVQIMVAYGLLNTFDMSVYAMVAPLMKDKSFVIKHPGFEKMHPKFPDNFQQSLAGYLQEVAPGANGITITIDFSMPPLTDKDMADLRSAAFPHMQNKTVHIEVLISYKNDLYKPEENREDIVLQGFNWNPTTNQANFAPTLWNWPARNLPPYQLKAKP